MRLTVLTVTSLYFATIAASTAFATHCCCCCYCYYCYFAIAAAAAATSTAAAAAAAAATTTTTTTSNTTHCHESLFCSSCFYHFCYYCCCYYFAIVAAGTTNTTTSTTAAATTTTSSTTAKTTTTTNTTTTTYTTSGTTHGVMGSTSAFPARRCRQCWSAAPRLPPLFHQVPMSVNTSIRKKCGFSSIKITAMLFLRTTTLNWRFARNSLKRWSVATWPCVLEIARAAASDFKYLELGLSVSMPFMPHCCCDLLQPLILLLQSVAD